ncbi:MAG: PLP-dependent aminotransferase family protein [Tabrizicola sp.]|nr:PLP-dependent aminotransferase family protein [Tabrizicola sp.]
MEILPIRIELPPKGSRTLRESILLQMKRAIVDGRLVAGLLLPPTRELARHLGVARNTIVGIYDNLLSEGYVETRLGSGTFVAKRAMRLTPNQGNGRNTSDLRLVPYFRTVGVVSPDLAQEAEFDLRLGHPDKSQFPFDVWRRLSNRALRTLERAPPVPMGPHGHPALCNAIAGHISFARAVACNPGDVIVTAGAQQAFGLIARILVEPGKTIVAVEDPGYPPLRQAFAAAGAKIAPVPLDHEGLRVDLIPDEAKIVCVTPSNQMPMGMSMSFARRMALLDRVHQTGGVIVEDDYEGEFRFAGRPLEALQTLDNRERVFYVGTFTKCMFPALRLGYAVGPNWARPALAMAKQLADWHCPGAQQETMAAFISEGHLVRHVRRMRLAYQHKRELLIGALRLHLPQLEMRLTAPGLHVSATLSGTIPAGLLVTAAGNQKLRFEDLSRFVVRRDQKSNGIVFGYGLIDAEKILPAVETLKDVMASL